jgi:hypothetical protein
MAGSWRNIYVISAMIAFYLNVFVLIAQAFMKAPALHTLAPTQSEPPFLVAQSVVMVVFIVLTVFVVKRFRLWSLSRSSPGLGPGEKILRTQHRGTGIRKNRNRLRTDGSRRQGQHPLRP